MTSLPPASSLGTPRESEAQHAADARALDSGGAAGSDAAAAPSRSLPRPLSAHVLALRHEEAAAEASRAATQRELRAAEARRAAAATVPPFAQWVEQRQVGGAVSPPARPASAAAARPVRLYPPTAGAEEHVLRRLQRRCAEAELRGHAAGVAGDTRWESARTLSRRRRYTYGAKDRRGLEARPSTVGAEPQRVRMLHARLFVWCLPAAMPGRALTGGAAGAAQVYAIMRAERSADHVVWSSMGVHSATNAVRTLSPETLRPQSPQQRRGSAGGGAGSPFGAGTARCGVVESTDEGRPGTSAGRRPPPLPSPGRASTPLLRPLRPVSGQRGASSARVAVAVAVAVAASQSPLRPRTAVGRAARRAEGV